MKTLPEQQRCKIRLKLPRHLHRNRDHPKLQKSWFFFFGMTGSRDLSSFCEAVLSIELCWAASEISLIQSG